MEYDDGVLSDSDDIPIISNHPYYQQSQNGGSEASKNESESVADHYNARPDAGIRQRGRSAILHLRDFNNWVKAVLIREFAPTSKLKVLDLACGKGGDLLKWDKASASHVTGVDIAEVSIQHARDRYKGMNLCFKAQFIVHDAFHKPWSSGLLPMKHYDIVSCQFAFHYSFDSEAGARTALSNVASVLRTGGYFFGVIPNAREIRRRLQDPEFCADGQTLKNQYFSLTMDKPVTVKFPSPFGIRYEFSLIDAVDSCPEYIVPFSVLESLAAEYGLGFIMEMPLQKFYETFSQMPEYQNLLHRMNIVEDDCLTLSPDELSVASLYLAFAFRKL